MLLFKKRDTFISQTENYATQCGSLQESKRTCKHIGGTYKVRHVS